MKTIKTESYSNEKTISLMPYYNTIKRYWLMIICFVLIGVTATTLIVLSITPTYRATSTLIIESNANNTLSIADIYVPDTTQREYYQTQVALLSSDTIIENVIEQLQLTQVKEFNESIGNTTLRDSIVSFFKNTLSLTLLPSTQDKSNKVNDETTKQIVLQQVKKNLVIEPIRNTQLVNIHFESISPNLASQVANAIGQAYLNFNLEAQIVATTTTSNWLTQRLSELKENLSLAEKALSDYLKSEELIELSGIDELAGQEVSNLSIRVSEAQEKRYEIESLSSLIQRNNVNALLSVSEISNHPQVRDIKAAEIDAERNVSELAKRYGAKHDKMIQATAELASIRNRANILILGLADGIQKELSSARRQEAALEKELANKKAEYQSIIEKRAQYESLKRDVESNRQLYETFLNRQKETSATADFAIVNARFTNTAKAPQKPYSPQMLKFLVISFAGSLLLGIYVSFLLDTYKNVFEKAEDIEEKLNTPVLGSVPMVKLNGRKGKDFDHTLYTSSYAGSFSESIRTIRTKLLLSKVNKKNTVLAITSSNPDEGKTTISVSLAQSLAKVGKTLLIDCDLRIPSIGKYYNLPQSQTGLINILQNNSDISENIFHDTSSSLDILPSGMLAANPLELISSTKFSDLINQLRETYDHIILDTPPLLAVSDTLVLGKIAEGMLLVIKANSTSEKQLIESINLLKETNISIDGVVLNLVSTKYIRTEYQQYHQYNNQTDHNSPAS